MPRSLVDLRQAARSLRKAPGLTAVAIGSLALGLGANVTVFSVVREMILDDLSARRPDRLARVEGIDLSYSQYRQLRPTGAFEDLAFYRNFGDRIWHTENRSEIVWKLATSANFFDVLGIHAYAGRLYSQADQGRELAVASYGFWRKRLHGDPHALGQPVHLAGGLYTLIGVLPRDYRSIYGHGVSPELYLSDPGNSDPHDRLYGLFGRLRAGASVEQTRQAFAAAAERLKGPDPARRILELRPMSGLRANAAKGGDDRLFLIFFLALFCVAAMLALIGCSNVAGLLTVRTLNRRKELAIRKALGATRTQLLRPLLAEGLVLVLSGAGLGLAVDAFLRGRLSELRWPSAYGIPFEFHFQGDTGLLLYAAAAALAALLVSSVVPALRGADTDLGLAMKETAPSFSVRRWDTRNGFVMLQVVLSMVLLTVSSLFARSIFYLTARGPGFDAVHTLIAAVHPPPGRDSADRAWELRRQALQQVQSLPGVQAVTSIGILPLMGEIPGDLVRHQSDPLSSARNVYVMGAGENYFTTLQVPILRGRDFETGDRGRTPVPVILNATLARLAFAGQDPIGEQLLIGRQKQTTLEVVGVAADFKMRTMGEANMPAVFMPDLNAQLLVRVAGNPAMWTEPLRNALSKVDGTAALDVRPLAEAVGGALFPMRVATGFLGSLSALGLALSLIGLYGSVSYAVGRRTREFGVRAALGASRRRIVWTALRDGVAVLACGAAIGTPLAILAIRPLVDLFPAGLDPWAPAALSGVGLLLMATGAVAIWLPARRAARIDPSLALRQE
ncbi:MAG: ABC transporter permease [Bryobacteraceae bacterium]